MFSVFVIFVCVRLWLERTSASQRSQACTTRRLTYTSKPTAAVIKRNRKYDRIQAIYSCNNNSNNSSSSYNRNNTNINIEATPFPQAPNIIINISKTRRNYIACKMY